jgi:alpha,alpha-trehalase
MRDENTNLPDILKFEPDKIADAFAHIEAEWPALTMEQSIDNGTLVGLPHPFIAPSVKNESHFAFQEMYYWDSYFISHGLLALGHDDLAAGMLENLLSLMRRFHIIPNASRTYHTDRSQPPFLTSFIFDIYERQDKDDTWLKERLHVAEREYHEVWTCRSHPNWRNVFEDLSRYYEVNLIDHLAETESGWDMTTRFQGKCLSYIPIDLNCLLYKYEIDFARGAEISKDEDSAAIWRDRAAKRAETVNKYLWNNDEGFFFDLDYMTMQHSPVWSLAAYYSLWSGLATPDQARRIVEKLPDFMHSGGLATTRSPDEYIGDIPTQWAYPNGWAPLHWLVVHGLKSYGFYHEAEVIARSWIRNNLDHFERNKVFREAYNVINPELPPRPGLYPPQLGFGWTNSVFIDLSKKFLNDKELMLV